jgi:hypothetical protein
MESGRLTEARVHASELFQLNYFALQYEAAISTLNESCVADPNWHATAVNLPVLAMARYQLSSADEAMHGLEQSEQKTTESIANWWDRLELTLILGDAAAEAP